LPATCRRWFAGQYAWHLGKLPRWTG